jgi:Tol biopolymer transport system component
VSHLRWAPNGSQVVFTLSRPNGAGGVLQDLYLWNLDDAGPIQLTSNGASFGAEFLGSPEVWHR